jgi:RHS repeat-associated protein
VASFDYSYDTIGNLTVRTDNDTSYTERFCYDALNRLTAYALGAACTGSKTVGYNAVGNITSKSDTGTYAYPTPGTAQPHAVSSITGTVNGVVNPHYSYNANGNLTCTSTGANCTGTVAETVTPTSFNMAGSIALGSSTVALTYDSEHNRIVQARTVGGTTTTTTYLHNPISGTMSENRVTGGVTSWVDYLAVDGQIVAQRSTGSSGGSTTWGSFTWGAANWSGAVATWTYFTLDPLASVAVVADQSGAVVQRLGYDAWGKPRNPNGTDAACGTITPPTTRGYTNQEQIAALCAVNLNARIYDPTIARFLSADSIVPNPADGQAFNRYSYVDNRPLSATDPSGHDVETVVVAGARIFDDAANIGWWSMPQETFTSSIASIFGSISINIPSANTGMTGSDQTNSPSGTITPASGAPTNNSRNLARASKDSDDCANSDGKQTDSADYSGNDEKRTTQNGSGAAGTETVVVTAHRQTDTNGLQLASATTIPSWAWKAAGAEEILGGGPEDPAADIVAGITLGIGAATMMNKIPKDAKDPNGAKAPGKPGPAEGFNDPKGGERWVKNPNGRGNGWLDDRGRVWVPSGQGGSAHGGPQWDVQTPGGGYDNVYPGGKVRPGG